MKISKWVDFGQEVEVEISIDDIRGALAEAFSEITEDRFGEPGPNRGEVLRTFNLIAAFLNAITDEQIELITEPNVRKLIGGYFEKAASRFYMVEIK